MADTAVLAHFDLHRNALFQAGDVADDADALAAGVETVQGGEGQVETVGVERAEAFVEEE